MSWVFFKGICTGFVVASFAFLFLFMEMETKAWDVGIDYIKRCSVDTPTVQSNWCEIVWRDGWTGTVRRTK